MRELTRENPTKRQTKSKMPKYIISLEKFDEQLDREVGLEELVLCRDCKWYTQFKNILGGEFPEGECEGWGFTKPDDYCSRGERKTE